MTRAQLEMAYASNTVRWAGDALELSDPEIGRVVGATGKTIQRWRGQRSTPHPAHRHALEKLNQFRHLLELAFRDRQAMLEWLQQPVPSLGGQTPLATMLAGDLDRVLQSLATMTSGAHV